MHKQTEVVITEAVRESFGKWRVKILAALTDSATIIWQIQGGKNICRLGQQQPNGSQACQDRAGNRTDGRTDGRTHGQDPAGGLAGGPAGERSRRGGGVEEELAALLLLTTSRQKAKLKIKNSKKKWIWRFSVTRSAKTKKVKNRQM